MIANRSDRKMSTEILSFDSALLSPMDQSFFSDDCPQTQHCSELSPQLASDQWLQHFDDIRSFCDGLELSLTYEPELTLEAMTKEVDIQYQSKADDLIDYLDSTAFLSPISMEPSSPQINAIDSYTEPQVDESAISLLEEILSANSNDSVYHSDQSYDSDRINVITEPSEDQPIESPLPEPKATPKRQYKRKVQAVDQTVKPSKRSKASVTEKRQRKRNQNKDAANRYRQKKRAELETIEQQNNRLVGVNSRLKEELQKLQMEFKVVHPLAMAAFATDPNKSLQLQMLDLRVLTNNLLD